MKFENVRFNLFNGIYTINRTYTTTADPHKILKVFKRI